MNSPFLTDETALPLAREHALRALETRRSVGTGFLSEPGPSETQLERLLTIAARVPDHGRLTPWRFIVFSGDARKKAGERLSAIYRQENHFMDPERLEKFAGIMTRVFTYAPLVVLVVSRPDPLAKVPVREQEASCGAACMNLLHAAHAMGFGATWLTGWAADSQGAGALYGLTDYERVAGIIHIGTIAEKPDDRPRPDLAQIVTHWTDPGSTP